MPFFSIRPHALFSMRARRGVPYPYRQILTTGYVNAGYANSVAWRNVNSMTNATDTTTNLGDLLQYAGGYIGGMHGKDIAYVFGTTGSGSEGFAASSTTSCFSMRTNSAYSRTASMNTYGTVGSSQSIMDSDENGVSRYGYTTGQNSTAHIYKFDFLTEVSTTPIGTSFVQNSGRSTGSAAAYTEKFGYWWSVDNQATPVRTALKLVFATETQSTPSFQVGDHPQQKGGTTNKAGYTYAGNEGSWAGGNYLRKTSFITETVVSSTAIAKPIQNSGEENYAAGQDQAYMLGMYNGVQNNRSSRFNFATDTGFELGASGQPSGIQTGTGSTANTAIPGRSSGIGSWKA